MKPFALGSAPTLADLESVARGGRRLSFAPAAKARVSRARAVVERVAAGGEA
ncbi:MAG: hypothetical protein FD126_1967, partial [Elusimicrobia bacterium]